MRAIYVASAIVLVLAVLGGWYVYHSSSEPSSAAPVPAQPSTPEEPVLTNEFRKDVNARVLVGSTYVSPANIVVNQDDRVFVRVTAVESNITLFEPLFGRSHVIPQGTDYIVVLVAYQNLTLSCTEGCTVGTGLEVIVQ